LDDEGSGYKTICKEICSKKKRHPVKKSKSDDDDDENPMKLMMIGKKKPRGRQLGSHSFDEFDIPK
jgi:hypothetical protein